MKGKVFLLIGDPGTGKSSLRTKLYDIPFFKEDGILVQDISPDGEGSWIAGKRKEEIKEKRQRYKEYTNEYYEGAKETIADSKAHLRLFIADMGGRPNPDKDGISDKEDFLKNADGYIILKGQTSEWEPYLKEGKIRLVYPMPAERVSEETFDNHLKNIAEDLKVKLENGIEHVTDYIARVKSIIKKEGYIPIDLSEYNAQEIKSQTDLDKIPPLVNDNRYCIYGRGPITLSAKLLSNVSSCAVFDPKFKNPVIELPLNAYENSDFITYEIVNDKILVKTPRFIKKSHVPVLNADFFSDQMYLECGGPVWMQLDLFLQLKEKVKIRGIYNKRDDLIYWIH